jgi:pre-mRNA-splicing factor CDC5/CEF1
MVEEDEMDTMPIKLKKQQGAMVMRAKLGALPAPQNEVEISMPELAEDEPTLEDAIEEDAADADARRQKLAEERLEVERQKRSQPVKMDLPRPILPTSCIYPTSFAPGDPQSGPPGSESSKLLHQAESLLHEELATLVANDAFLVPVKGAKASKKPDELPDVALNELSAAKDLLSAEMELFDQGELVTCGAIEAAKDDLTSFTYMPQDKRYKEVRMLGKREMLETSKHLYELTEKEVQREGKRSQKLEGKVERILGGHMMKAKQALQKIASLSEERETLVVETEVFETLRAREDSAVKTRVEELQEQVDREKKRNVKLQSRFRELQVLQKKLEDLLA